MEPVLEKRSFKNQRSEMNIRNIEWPKPCRIDYGISILFDLADAISQQKIFT